MNSAPRRAAVGFAAAFLFLAQAGALGAETRQPARKSASPTSRPAPARSYSAPSDLILGQNVSGRAGLFFADTAQVPEQGQGAFTGHFIFDSDDDFDQVRLPLALNYGIAPNVEINANLPFISRDLDIPAGSGIDDSQSGLGNFGFGAKVRIPSGRPDFPDFGIGAEIAYGPLSDDLGEDGVDINVRGMATYVMTDTGLLLNGGLGILRVDGRDIEITDPVTGGRVKINGDSDTEIQVNAGIGYPLAPGLTGIAELAINQFGEDDGVFALGVRGGRQIGLQAFLGIGLGSDAPDFSLGGGLSLPFGL